MTDFNKLMQLDNGAFANALQAPAPRIYANGFLLGQSLSDVSVVLQTNGIPTAIVNMSFTSAKTLAQQLQLLVENFESQTGHSILTMAQIAEKTGLGGEPN